MDDLIRGHTAQSLQEFNAIYANEMAEWMFAAGKDWGLGIYLLSCHLHLFFLVFYNFCFTMYLHFRHRFSEYSTRSRSSNSRISILQKDVWTR